MTSEITLNNNSAQLQNWHEELFKKEKIPFLQNQLDLAEKYNKQKFSDFSDTDMLIWFLHERKHLIKEHNRAERTVKEYERELSLFITNILTYHTEIDIDIDHIVEASLFKSLDSRHLRRYQEWLTTSSPYVLKKGSYSIATLERKTSIIKSFFIFLFKKKYIEEPIYEDLKIINTRKRERPNRDLGAMEIVTLLNGFRDIKHPVMFTIVHVLTTTGLRNEEFCNLKIASLQEDIISGGYYLDVVGKGNKKRQIPLKSKVVDTIKMFRAARGLLSIEKADLNEPLFTTNKGTAFKPTYLSKYVTTEINSLYISLGKEPDKIKKITPHYFRHAFAIISQKSGISVYTIMLSLGHERLETTEIYLEKVLAKENHAIHRWNSDLLGDYI
ncbi:tyrosine-type recombinase/integrase [Psychrobacillus sp. FSL H8-0487]|uniref:tyrosine-type recombinase/integrase n=1 Tax=Psychrobacillus sp. FSL H8-0487 TaxID=2921391 RepID=UPI0030F961DF